MPSRRPGHAAPGVAAARRPAQPPARRPRPARGPARRPAPAADVLLPDPRHHHPAARARAWSWCCPPRRSPSSRGRLALLRLPAPAARGGCSGLPCMWLAARASPALFRAAAYPLMFVSIAGPAAGPADRGDSRAAPPGGCRSARSQFQPSELAKLAFLLWGADLLARKEKLGQLDDWRQLLIPLLPGAGILCMLVMLGDDLGTTFMLLVIFLALLWVIGTPGRLYAGHPGHDRPGAADPDRRGAVPAPAADRLPAPAGQPDVARTMQSIQGKWAVGLRRLVRRGARRQQAEVGLGAERHDRLHLRHPGRGTGPGRHAVRARCSTAAWRSPGCGSPGRVQDTFVRLAAAGATAWIVVQALVNIGAVLGLLPITGVPLPLVSSGPVLAARDDGGARHADVVRQTRARGARGACRCRPRRAAARPKLAGPGPSA